MNLQDLPKDALIEITRKLHGSVGDTGRNNKQHYVELLSRDEYRDTAIQLAIEAADDATPSSAASASDAIASAAHGARAVASIIEGLKALIPPAGVQRSEVEAIVNDVCAQRDDDKRGELKSEIAEAIAEAIKQAPAQIKRIAVSARGEREIPAVVHPLFEDVLALAGLRHNILLVGPSGVGKSTIGAQIADALSLPFGALSCSGGMSESQLAGWLLPVADGGKFVYVPSVFVTMYENGGVFLLDELDAVDGNVVVFINSALANGGFFIPQRHEKPYVKRHDDFVCIAAANTFGHGGDMVYAARERLDGATLDRFRSATLHMDYDNATEAKLVDSEVLEWGLAIRTKINDLKLRRVMSTRVMIQFSEQKANLDWGVDKWERSYFADWTKDEMRKIGRDV